MSAVPETKHKIFPFPVLLYLDFCSIFLPDPNLSDHDFISDFTVHYISLSLFSLLLQSIIPSPCPTAPTELSQTLPFPLAYSCSIIVGAFTHCWIKMFFYYSALRQALKTEDERLFLLLHKVDLDISSLSSFISRTPTDFKRRSVHVGREHWSQAPPMQIWR